MSRELYKHPIVLTTPEREHLLWLLEQEKRTGDYSGNQKQYCARRDRLIEKLTHRAQQPRAAEGKVK